MRGSLSDQLTETSNAKILRLELENQRLSSKVREMEEGALIHSAELNLQLEKENQRLLKRIEKLQESVQVVIIIINICDYHLWLMWFIRHLKLAHRSGSHSVQGSTGKPASCTERERVLRRCSLSRVSNTKHVNICIVKGNKCLHVSSVESRWPF